MLAQSLGAAEQVGRSAALIHLIGALLVSSPARRPLLIRGNSSFRPASRAGASRWQGLAGRRIGWCTGAWFMRCTSSTVGALSDVLCPFCER